MRSYHRTALVPVLCCALLAAAPAGDPESNPAADDAKTDARADAAPPTTARPKPQDAAAVDPASISYEDEPTGILTEIRQLTGGFERAGEAYFSRDMGWIIFQAAPKGEGQYQMYVARLKWKKEGLLGLGLDPARDNAYAALQSGPGRLSVSLGEPIRISPTPSRNTCGYFSPDGRSIIFGSTAGKEKPDEPGGGYQRAGRNYRWAFPTGMEIFRADDWRKAVDTPHEVEGGGVDLTKHPLTDNEVYDAEGSYSPDGKWICYTHGAGKDADIYVMRSDGTGAVQITDAPGYDGGPFFSPDGRRLVYRSDRKGNDLLQVFVADLAFDDAGNVTGLAKEHQLTDDRNVNWGPYWHPGGEHLVYATSAHGHENYELYLMRDDGSAKTRVTDAAGADVLPVFSPDGQWLMWSAKRTPDKTTQIFIARFTMPEEKAE